MALEHQSGKLLWYNQVKPHDLFNLDFQISPVLATVKINGADRPIVIGSGKLGTVYAFEPDTGKTLWSTPVGLHQNDDLAELLGGRATPAVGFAAGMDRIVLALREEEIEPPALPNPQVLVAYQGDAAKRAAVKLAAQGAFLLRE